MPAVKLALNRADWNHTNIACRATDYPDQFRAKMDKWHRASKLISFDADLGFVSPMDSAWTNTVLEGMKTAY